MKYKLLLVAASATLAAGLSLPAAAAPLAQPQTTAAATAPAPATDGARLIFVRQGCGRGWHRDWRGFCRPNRRYRRRRHCWNQRTYWGWRRVCRY